MEHGDGTTGDVQRALNATKKAEHRLSRVVQDREKATSQWQEYAKASRAAYYKEKERYLKALQGYDRDIQEAQVAQCEARRALRATCGTRLPASTRMGRPRQWTAWRRARTASGNA